MDDNVYELTIEALNKGHWNEHRIVIFAKDEEDAKKQWDELKPLVDGNSVERLVKIKQTTKSEHRASKFRR